MNGRRRILTVVLAATAALLGTSLIALARPQPAADFAPFGLEKEVWVIDLSSDGPGTERYLIEYRSEDDWTVTLLSNSARPALNGTTYRQAPNAWSFFDNMRRVTRTGTGQMTVDQWIAPGLFRSLEARGGWERVPSARAGEVILRSVERTSVAGRTYLTETRITYHAATELPISVDVLADDQLVRRFTYTRR